jgi:4,4'-diaponeurosporenoate glycosyltransferase
MDALLQLVIVLCWLGGLFSLWRIPLLENPAGPLPDRWDATIIVPARNEEKNLGRLLNALKGQVPPPREVIVVDDHSEDATARVAGAHGVRVLPSDDLPAGWTGKPWACWQGALAAKGRILLFLDADTFLAPGGLAKVLSAFLKGEGLLTIQPYHRMERMVEHLSAFFNIVTAAGLSAFTPLGSRIKPAGAFGPCLACTREEYLAFGGHTRVKDAVLENLLLGRHLLRLGKPVRCFGGKGTLCFQMYSDGLRSLIAGFGKGFATGAGAISFTMLLILSLWVFGGASVARHLLQEGVSEGPGSLPFWGPMYALYAVQIGWMLRRIGNFGFFDALLYPVPLLFFAAVFCLSLVQVFLLRSVRWKGRTIRTGKDGRSHP